MTHDERYEAVVKTFEFEADALTDAQLNAVRSVDDRPADGAIKKRDEFQTRAAAARHLASRSARHSINPHGRTIRLIK